MGAFAWKFIAPFGTDAEAILADAKRLAFEKGSYGKPYARGEPRAKNVAALLRACAEEGTCSILDVGSLGPAPAPGVAGPFPRKTLEAALGTARPTLAQVEAGAGELYEALGRGCAGYVVAYEGGKPTQVVFLGHSYD